jgi:DNA-binding transcriptional LysR family regulator
MPSIDRKKNIRVRDRATMTNLILGLNGFTVASGALSRELNGPDVVAVPLKMDEMIRVGLVMQGDTPLSSAGKIFVSAIRECCAERSYDAAGL